MARCFNLVFLRAVASLSPTGLLSCDGSLLGHVTLYWLALCAIGFLISFGAFYFFGFLPCRDALMCCGVLVYLDARLSWFAYFIWHALFPDFFGLMARSLYQVFCVVSARAILRWFSFRNWLATRYGFLGLGARYQAVVYRDFFGTLRLLGLLQFHGTLYRHGLLISFGAHCSHNSSHLFRR